MGEGQGGAEAAGTRPRVRVPFCSHQTFCHPPPGVRRVAPGPSVLTHPCQGRGRRTSSRPPRGVTPQSPSPWHRAPITMAGRIARVGTGGTGCGGPGVRTGEGPGGAELAVRESRYRGAKGGSGGCSCQCGDAGIGRGGSERCELPVRGSRYRGEAVLGVSVSVRGSRHRGAKGGSGEC